MAGWLDEIPYRGDPVLGTLVADTVTEISMAKNFEGVEVLNRGAGTIMCQVNSATAPDATHGHPIPAGSAMLFRIGGGVATVTLWSDVTPSYAVTGLDTSA